MTGRTRLASIILALNELADTESTNNKTKGDLAAALRRLTPLLAFYHTLSQGHPRVCLKNCGSISQDLTAALISEGFDARVVGHPGHFTCGVNVEGVGVDVDLSHLQFAAGANKVDRDRDLNKAFYSKIWENPYLIGKVTVGKPFPYSEPKNFDYADVASNLKYVQREIGDEPTFGSKADAQAMLGSL